MNQQPNQQPQPENLLSSAGQAVKRLQADVARQKIQGDPALLPKRVVRENEATEALRHIETEAGDV